MFGGLQPAVTYSGSARVSGGRGGAYRISQHGLAKVLGTAGAVAAQEVVTAQGWDREVVAGETIEAGGSCTLVTPFKSTCTSQSPRRYT
jgi:hypothetical protein